MYIRIGNGLLTRWVRLTIGLLRTSSIIRYCHFSTPPPSKAYIIDWCKLIESLFCDSVISIYHQHHKPLAFMRKSELLLFFSFILNHTVLLLIATWDAHFHDKIVSSLPSAYDTCLEYPSSGTLIIKNWKSNNAHFLGNMMCFVW